MSEICLEILQTKLKKKKKVWDEWAGERGGTKFLLENLFKGFLKELNKRSHWTHSVDFILVFPIIYLNECLLKTYYTILEYFVT